MYPQAREINKTLILKRHFFGKEKQNRCVYHLVSKSTLSLQRQKSNSFYNISAGNNRNKENVGLLHREGLCHFSTAIPTEQGEAVGPDAACSQWQRLLEPAGMQVSRSSAAQTPRFLSVVNNSFGNLHYCPFEQPAVAPKVRME